MNISLSALSFALFTYLCFLPNLNAEKEKKFVIFLTSDIHSQINSKNSGWLNLAETIRKYQKSAGKENSLLIDCGDTIPGSIIGTLSKGEAALAVLNTLKYDAWIIGNHDFEFGDKTLNKISKNMDCDILAANLITDNIKNLKKWKIYNINGIKIAVIGLTSPHIDEWLWGNKIAPYKIKPPLQSIEEQMPEIFKAEPHAIILAIHHGRYSAKRLKGFNISRIAEKFPQIDLILGGHSHQEVPGDKCGKTSWYVEAGCHAEKFGWIEITVNTENKKVVDIKSKLIPVDYNLKIDPDLKQSVKKWKQKAKIFASQKVGFTTEDITPIEKKELFSPMNELFCKAISNATGSDVAFHGTVVKSAKFADTITEQDIFNVIPYEDTVCVLELTGYELKNIIKEQIIKKDKGRFQSPFGINLTIHKNNSISINLENGDKLDIEKRYKTAFSSYVLAGAGGRFPILKNIALMKKTNGRDTEVNVRDALRKYIKQNSPLKVKTVKRIFFEK